MFDEDQNGLVDATEFSSGLSVLCGGDRDEKMNQTTNGEHVLVRSRGVRRRSL